MEKEAQEIEDRPDQWILSVSQDIRIRADVPHNWVIEQRVPIRAGVNAGKDRWTCLGYYGDISLACASLFEKHLDLITKEKGKRRIKNLLQELPECVSKILDACNQLKTQLKKCEKTQSTTEGK